MTIIECAPTDAFVDEVTGETFCMECGDGGAYGDCVICSGPMCDACIQLQHDLCRECHNALSDETDVVIIDMDHMLAEMGL